MAPNATLQLIISAADNDRDAYREACENLAEWLRRGGFKPQLAAMLTSYPNGIPGTGTQWALRAPASGFSEWRNWRLVRYDWRGGTIESYPLD